MAVVAQAELRNYESDTSGSRVEKVMIFVRADRRPLSRMQSIHCWLFALWGGRVDVAVVHGLLVTSRGIKSLSGSSHLCSPLVIDTVWNRY